MPWVAGLALSLLMLPSAAGATLMEFGAEGTPNLADVNAIAPSVNTTLDIAFSTTGNDDPFMSCATPGCLLGWTGTLSTTGTLQILDYTPGPNAASGSGETTCDSSFLPATSCQTNGGDSANGEAGTGIAMFSVTVGGGSPGDMILYTGDFTDSGFEAIPVEQTLASVVPEPRLAALLGMGFLAFVLARQRSV